MTACDYMPYQTGAVHRVGEAALANLTLEEILGLDPEPAAQFKYLPSYIAKTKPCQSAFMGQC